MPTAIYGVNLLLAGVAWLILQNTLILVDGVDSPIAVAVRQDRKGPLSAVLYAAGIALAFVWTPVADLFYVVVALMWLVPDRRFTASPTGGDQG